MLDDRASHWMRSGLLLDDGADLLAMGDRTVIWASAPLNLSVELPWVARCSLDRW
ncbi:hypothetical protein ACLOJK_004703, partial [Asimina triloba]